jgi:hypothetical protein
VMNRQLVYMHDVTFGIVNLVDIYLATRKQRSPGKFCLQSAGSQGLQESSEEKEESLDC